MTDALEPGKIDAELTELPGWRAEGGALLAAFAAPTSVAAMSLITAVAEAAEAANHHPDVDWRYAHVYVTLTSHDVGGAITRRDVELAGRISALADAAGALPEPGRARRGA